MIRLTVKEGSIVRTVTLAADKAFVGRLGSNTVRLSDPSVSRKHCIIRRTSGDTLEVIDLNSRNGTRRNGEQIERARISVGDSLSLGDVELKVEALEGRPIAASEPPAGSGREEPGPPGTTPDAGDPAREKKALLSEAHRTTFSEELYRQVRRMPWWAASSFLHVLLIYILFLVPVATPRQATPFGTLDGNLEEDLSGYLDQQADDPRDLLEDRPDEAPDLPPPVIDEMDLPPLEQPEAFDDPEPIVPKIGPAPADFGSVADAEAHAGAITVPNVEFGRSGAAAANRHAMGLLRNSLGGGRGDSLGLLKKLRAADILVVEGHYDKVETILDMLGVAYERTTVRRFSGNRLAERKVLFVNCSNEAPTQRVVRRIRSFVQGGGYLVGSDWALENVMKKAFPGTVRPLVRNGRNIITPNEVIRIHAAPEAASHFLLKGTALAGRDAKWWLEESSYPMEVVGKKVTVLIESDDLERRYGTRAVAVTFRQGRGRVLHMLGHFFQKEGNLRGTFSAQRLIANFLLAAIRKQ